MPTLLQNGSTLTLPGRGEARWYTPMGVCVVAEQYDDSAITVPSQAGILLLSLFESDSPITTYRMMIY